MNVPVRKKIDAYAKKHGIEGLTQPSLIAIIEEKERYTIETAKKFLRFQQRINNELLQHPVIIDNKFTAWFRKGPHTKEHVKAFVVQFSVFSNLFLIAQLNKTINADSLESMRASKEILANEIGVIFKAPKHRRGSKISTENPEDPDLVSTEGSVEGGTFRFQAAHFEWLLRMAAKLDLGFTDCGKRRHGTKSTLLFCDELARLYGSEDYLTSQAASYAVENWAAAGFWDELVEGFSEYNKNAESKLPLAFFTYHSRIEAQHALHTQEEIEEIYFDRDIDENSFIKFGNEMLDGVAAFWNGLDEQRKSL